MNQASFTFSDTIAGYVTGFDRQTDTYGVRTSGGQEFAIKLKSNTYAQLVRNLGDPYQDCDRPDARHARCPAGSCTPTASSIRRPAAWSSRRSSSSSSAASRTSTSSSGPTGGSTRSRRSATSTCTRSSATSRWTTRNYRTTIKLSGEKEKDNYRQETDTISRLVYGLSSAYMLTGEDRFLEAADKGTEYLRDHMRFYDADENIVYWYHGIDVQGRRETKVFASEFGDDYYAIPAYEQIYALAGPIQNYRITGDPRILRDAELTVDLFDRFYLDRNNGGYFSHLDPVTLDPRSEALGANKGKKNWNSVGDHAPAYLINLWLATGEDRYARMLEYTFDTIARYFPNYDESPFVQEKFLEDWSPDRTHMWQQNRGVVGHNLKIAWNLMRMYSLKPKPEYEALARKIAEVMPAVGGDQLRGGWYDVMERMLQPGRGALPLRLPRPQGLVAAGAGHPGVPDPATACWATTSICAWPANRRPSTTPSSWITTTAPCTSTCWPTASPT